MFAHENFDAAPIGPQADRLLRFMVAERRLTTTYPMERLKEIDFRRATATRAKLATRNERWMVRAA